MRNAKEARRILLCGEQLSNGEEREAKADRKCSESPVSSPLLLHFSISRDLAKAVSLSFSHSSHHTPPFLAPPPPPLFSSSLLGNANSPLAASILSSHPCQKNEGREERDLTYKGKKNSGGGCIEERGRKKKGSAKWLGSGLISQERKSKSSIPFLRPATDSNPNEVNKYLSKFSSERNDEGQKNLPLSHFPHSFRSGPSLPFRRKEEERRKNDTPLLLLVFSSFPSFRPASIPSFFCWGKRASLGIL